MILLIKDYLARNSGNVQTTILENLDECLENYDIRRHNVRDTDISERDNVEF